MRDYPQHNIPTKKKESQELIDDLVLRYATDNLMKMRLELLVAVAQKEQMIEDHKLYMGAIKEE